MYVISGSLNVGVDNGVIDCVENNKSEINGSLTVTPAMEIGISDHLWTSEDIVELIETKEKANRPTIGRHLYLCCRADCL